jgi:phospholipase D1/2
VKKQKLLRGIALLAAVLVGLVLLWRFTPLADILQPARLAEHFERFNSLRWLPFALIGAYIVGGLVVFPVTLLGATVALMLPPYKAALVAFTGIVLSASLLHWIGKRLLKGRLKSALGSTMERLDKTLSDRSVLTIATIRMIPIAPFTLVNLAAGALGVRFRDYLLGTALGLAPGVVVTALFGNQLRAFFRHPTLREAALLGAVGIVWIGIAIVLQKWAARHRHSRPTSSQHAKASALESVRCT